MDAKTRPVAQGWAQPFSPGQKVLIHEGHEGG